MDLVIVESPTKARTLGKYLGEGYQIEATMGHVRDLPESKIGVEVNGGVTMEYVIPEGKADTARGLTARARRAKVVYLATDPDREGEAIAWHVREVIGSKSQIKRIAFHEITQSAIAEALAHPREIDAHLVDAQQARRALDRLVGYKLSPMLWRKVRKGLSAGRVQSVAVRLIVEKEREIERFKSEEYWVVKVLVSSDGGREDQFWVQLTKIGGEKAVIASEGEVARVVGELESADYRVCDVRSKELHRLPSAPFTTSTLQQAAGNRLGWTAKRTMQIAQSLYEEGYITYHRTDSVNLSAESVVAAREVIARKYGADFALEKPRVYRTKSKSAQEAHEAIRPTDAAREVVTHEGARLYDLIWKRFIASQMAQEVLDQKVVEVEGSGGRGYILEARGEVVKFAGWSRVYEDGKRRQDPEMEGEAEFSLEQLPDLAVGSKLLKKEIDKAQKFTQPPPRFTEASLIKTLEELGIGRPSTYAPTISTIVERRYVEKDARKLKPTVLGIAVNDFLVSEFPDIVDYHFTARMEEDLDLVAEGKESWEKLIVDFYKPFLERLNVVGDVAGRVAVAVTKTGETCPDCREGDVVIRFGRFGRFLACSRFPDCKYKANYVQVVEGVKCPKDGGDVVVKRSRNGKTFYGCGNYPKCDFASWTRPKAEG